jgi:hypothetical protein
MRGHRGDRKTQWFSRLRFGASGRARRRNLEADTRLKEIQAQVLGEERELLSLKRREHELNVENAEIKRSLTLFGVVFVGASLVAGLVLGAVDPSLSQPGPNLFELTKLLLSR